MKTVLSVRSGSSKRSLSVGRRSHIRQWKAAKDSSGFSKCDNLGIDMNKFELSNRFVREMKHEDHLDNLSESKQA